MGISEFLGVTFWRFWADSAIFALEESVLEQAARDDTLFTPARCRDHAFREWSRFEALI